MKITPHFSLEEASASDTAKRLDIDNSVPEELLGNIHKTCEKLEEIRALFNGLPILVSSFYRCPALNAKVGGAKNSAHMDGRACDFNVKGLEPREVLEKVASSKITFDQFIVEQDKRGNEWCHIAVEKDGAEPRNQILYGIKGDTSSSFTRVERG
jgi:hypothetical protein